MRTAFCQSLLAAANLEQFVFLTGDLGYKALEPLAAAMGKRFINAGVAEQNMISVAAGLARVGMRPWAYSIAPFIYSRPMEQIRNDLCLHDLAVILVGNGGGYGYGVMGATHHALEDYGQLLCLPNMRVCVPAFDADVQPAIAKLMQARHPTYLRLGVGEEPRDFTPPPYAAWRKLLSGEGPTALVVGPLAGGLLDPLRKIEPGRRPNLWVLCEMPIQPPAQFLEDVKRTGRLFVIEEHVVVGSVGEMIAHYLLSHGLAPPIFVHRCARGYVSGLYGSQKFHRAECGLDVPSLANALLGRDA
jgi:transketolase